MGVRVIVIGERGKGDAELYDSRAIQREDNWSEKFAPRLIKSRDGTIHLDTPFSRLLGKPPIMVPGMTPSTVQAGFVSAVLDAGYHVELAGGGHYNANALRAKVIEIQACSVAELRDMTYEETVLRMVRLMYVAHENRWIDISLRNLTGDWMRRIEERFAGVIAPLSDDSGYFLAISQRRGQKPVPFIPVLDVSFEVWFKKDSLWAAEDVEAVFDQDIIPSIDFLAPQPRAARVPAGVKITTTDKEITYQLGKSLPTNPAWLSCLAGSQLNWLGALVRSTSVIQGSSYISNPIRRLFYPRPHEKVVISLSNGQPTSITAYG
ncbi:hypothetical protein F5050DRAFT_1827606 [Lentinula boryana]|uniref:Uncharacterized protein n=1 Tax=Lentinula boryana TaxID=40481 RepID=A0ABQ8QAD6_9AGAR|nr:hypothetical protein F5050DRAFT_1827606 [Lentinula boryana]